MGLLDTHPLEKPKIGTEPREAIVPARTIPFSKVWPGLRGRVVAVHSDDPDAVRLQEMGLSLGAEFVVSDVAPFGDPVQIRLRGYRLCLRRREAMHIEVEVLGTEAC